MECISPLTLLRENKQRDIVPCGQCLFCLQTKRHEWSFRLAVELKKAETAVFITLTYEDEHLPRSDCGYPSLNKRDLQLFKKKLRKSNAKEGNRKIRYYSVGEYGTRTFRPHYHSIMFNLYPDVDIQKSWDHGNVYLGNVTPASIAYVAKYCVNRRQEDWNETSRVPPFAHMSRKPGIGQQYLETHKKWHKVPRNYVQSEGKKARLPRYYKNKLYSEKQIAKWKKEFDQEKDLNYWKEIDELKEHHDNPEWYREERIRFAHELVLKTINHKNKF